MDSEGGGDDGGVVLQGDQFVMHNQFIDLQRQCIGIAVIFG